MTADTDVIAWKYANAFVPDAEMSSGARRLFLFGSDSSVDWLRRRMGGLWVGGAVTLTRDALYFGPNALNGALHADDTSQSVALDRVLEVSDRFGWLTRIVDVRTDDGETFTFRCFGARSFAEQIRGAVQALRA
ncbi:MAG: hypothetical protein J0H65_14935 [Rhizobiales bacterium]|nr:hypothetical protein [Hyphomicrobiales bacterium]